MRTQTEMHKEGEEKKRKALRMSEVSGMWSPMWMQFRINRHENKKVCWRLGGGEIFRYEKVCLDVNFLDNWSVSLYQARTGKIRYSSFPCVVEWISLSFTSLVRWKHLKPWYKNWNCWSESAASLGFNGVMCTIVDWWVSFPGREILTRHLKTHE